MALCTTSSDGGERSRTRALLARIGRVLRWPLVVVWAGIGLITKVLLAAVSWMWSWVARASGAADVVMALALFGIAVSGPPDPYANPETLLVASQLLPLGLVRRQPVGAALVMAAGNLIGLFAIDYYPAVSIIALVVVVGVVASRVERTTAAQVAAVADLALLAALWHPDFQPQTVAFMLVAVLLALVFGDNLRSRQQAESGLVVAEEQRILEARQRALLEERSRIARELHDVVAHHMSLIAVQSQSAPRRIADLPPEGAADFEEINAAARNALTEMRRVLAVLRDDRSAAERAPQPGVDALPTLIAEAQKAGQAVALRITGEPRPLRDALDVSIYRIVQESLTNVRRHADAMATDVTISYRADEVHVRVTDDGDGDGATGGHTGHGLLGLRERVTLLGGRLSAGGGDGGGFVVDASLPYDAPAAAP
jgi:signal transduction histidine kinase